MKIVFFGTSNVALPILEELNTHHQVLGVVTNPDAPVGRSGKPQETAVSALAHDLKLPAFKPEKVRGNDEFYRKLKNIPADVFVVVAFGTILPPGIINLPPLKTVNVHFSLLPKYRGPSPIQFALLNGDQQTGITIFILDEKVDSGPLLAQKIINIEPSDNYFTLSDRLAKISAHLLLDTLSEYQNGKTTPLPQEEGAASYTKIIAKEDGNINWQKTASEIYNQFRAFYIWPGIFTLWNGKKLKITDCVATEPRKDGLNLEKTAEISPGSVLEGGKVVCGALTILEIKSLQLEGKNETAMGDFLNGYRGFVGSQLA